MGHILPLNMNFASSLAQPNLFPTFFSPEKLSRSSKMGALVRALWCWSTLAMVAAWGETYDEANFLQLHNLNETKEVQAQVPKCHLDFVFVWVQVGCLVVFLFGGFSHFLQKNW